MSEAVGDPMNKNGSFCNIRLNDMGSFKRNIENMYNNYNILPALLAEKFRCLLKSLCCENTSSSNIIFEDKYLKNFLYRIKKVGQV